MSSFGMMFVIDCPGSAVEVVAEKLGEIEAGVLSTDLPEGWVRVGGYDGALGLPAL